MGLRWLFATVITTTALLGGVAHAGSDPAAAASAGPAPSPPASGDLSLVLSIRALAVGPVSLPASAEVERVKASTGEGTTRWPTAQVAKGVYISVMPACIPGVDEPLGPPVNRRAGTARRR